MKLCFIRKKTKTKDKIAIKNNNISSYVAEESTLLGQVIKSSSAQTRFLHVSPVSRCTNNFPKPAHHVGGNPTGRCWWRRSECDVHFPVLL